MTKMSPLAQELYSELVRMPCINSHSHLLSEAERLKREVDALVFFGHAYPLSDLHSAGMSEAEAQRALTPGLALEKRWNIWEPYWRAARFTGYSQSILEAFSDLFGVHEFTAETVGPLSEAIRAQATPGFYRTILRNRCGIETTVMQMDDLVDVDRELFMPMPRLNRLSMVDSLDKLRAIERDHGASIGSLAEHVQVIQSTCDRWKNLGVAGVKLSQSYHRRMDFTERDLHDAQRVFGKLLAGEHPGLHTPEGRLLEDYMVFECCRAASAADLTIQFHLGLRAGNWGGLEGSTPAPMVALLRAFPEARFDLSHSGYPYLREGGVLAKTFPNVYLNLSWIHIVSPVGVRGALSEWLQMVPYNKIIGFGDDVYYPEIVYGHLKIARQNVAIVLAQATEEGVCTEEGALDVARAVFYDNPKKLYCDTC
jgi:predicted TIM-barrel fold metal-dependent hydrolase